MILTAIFFFLITFRLLFIVFNKKLFRFVSQGPCGDATTYFYLIQFFRKNNCGVPDKRSLITNLPVLVPALYMKIVARLFSDKFLFRFQWVPNYLLFLFGSGIFCFIIQDFYLSGQGYFFLISCVTLFISNPDNISFDDHRIQFLVLQPRYFAMLANSLFWLLFLTYDNSLFLDFVCIILLIVALNVSIFSRQSIFFTVLLFSIVSFSLHALILMVISFLCSILLFRNEFWPSLLPQIKYSYGYYLSYYKPKKTNKIFRDFIAKIISRPFINSYPYVPIVLFILFQFIHSSDFILFTHRLSSLNLALLIIFFSTAVRKFAFLGECWRYLSFNYYYIFPIYGSLYLVNLNIEFEYKSLILALILGFNVINVLINRRALFKNKTDSLKKLLERNNQSLQKAVWYGIPYRVSTMAVALGIGEKTSEYQYGNHSNEIHTEYFSQYPYLKWNTKIIEDHKVTHILLEKEFELQAQKSSGFSTTKLKLVDENEYYSIFKI